MKCDRVQRALSVRLSSERIDSPLYRHASACPTCGVFLAGLERLEGHVTKWPIEPPADLQSRIASEIAAQPIQSNAGLNSRLQRSLSRLKENQAMIKRLSWGGAAVVALCV